MNQKEFDQLVTEVRSKTMDLLQGKGAEYAGSEDRLANFKRNAVLSGVEPMTVLHVYMAKHWDAFSNYVRATQAGKKVILSEPIEGRLHDLINYAILACALLDEVQQRSNVRTAETLSKDIATPLPSLKVEMLGEEPVDELHIRSVEGRVAKMSGASYIASFLRLAMMAKGPVNYEGVLISAYKFPEADEWKVL